MNSQRYNFSIPSDNLTVKPAEEYIPFFHRALLDLHPGLKLRWSRIYGLRWAHIYGNSTDISYESLKIQLNPAYGLNIENASLLTDDELEQIITALKRCFADGNEF